MSEVLSSRDFVSVEEVLEIAGATDEAWRDVAEAALQSLRPGLIVNWVSGGSHVNVLYLPKILHQYVGGDLTLLGEIPDDPTVSQAVKKFLPIMEFTPDAPAAKGLLAAAVSQLIAACLDRSRTQSERVGKRTDSRLSRMADAAQGLAFQHLKSAASVFGTRVPGGTDTVSGSDAAIAVPDGARTGAQGQHRQESHALPHNLQQAELE